MRLNFTLFFLALVTSIVTLGQEWRVVLVNENVIISVADYTFENQKDDINHQRLIFKYENITDKVIVLKFSRAVNYYGTYKKQEQRYSIELPPHSTKQYNSDRQNNRAYYLFQSDNQKFIKTKLQGYKVIDIILLNK